MIMQETGGFRDFLEGRGKSYFIKLYIKNNPSVADFCAFLSLCYYLVLITIYRGVQDQ